MSKASHREHLLVQRRRQIELERLEGLMAAIFDKNIAPEEFLRAREGKEERGRMSERVALEGLSGMCEFDKVIQAAGAADLLEGTDIKARIAREGVWLKVQVKSSESAAMRLVKSLQMGYQANSLQETKRKMALGNYIVVYAGARETREANVESVREQTRAWLELRRG